MKSRRLALVLAASLVVFAACDDDDPADGGDTTQTASDMEDGSTTVPTDASATSPDGSATSDDAATTDDTTTPSDDATTTADDVAEDMTVIPPDGSAGCGQALGDAAETWHERTLDVGGNARTFYLWLPANYDPARAYPIVYQWHGCSSNAERQNNNPPVQNQSGEDAIHVRGRAADNCWDTAESGPDIPYFDALLPAVEATVCVDTGRRYATGYSSGSFMSHRLACLRGDLLAGVATIAGGQGGNNCAGAVPALLIHDSEDGTVDISTSINARDAHLERNGCDADAGTTPWVHAPCVSYDGCPAELPVVWCETTGEGHGRQDGLAAPAFWDFVSSL